MKPESPHWVASGGIKRDDIVLGSYVTFDAILKEGCPPREFGTPGALSWRGWHQDRNYKGSGIITGLRFVCSGRVLDEDGKPKKREREIFHRGYSVTYSIRHAPVLVLSNDIELAPWLKPDEFKGSHRKPIELPSHSELAKAAAVVWSHFDLEAAGITSPACHAASKDLERLLLQLRYLELGPESLVTPGAKGRSVLSNHS